ncbi:hypothetical protein KJ693_03005 [bacterium]|nr:hypothetical protein [bacterium]MBU1614260.1 hypothetical protein [bacterium]
MLITDRIGQKENVMVYRMITKDTFEEKINEMLKRKKELADLTVSVGEKWVGEMSNQELKDIFDLCFPFFHFFHFSLLTQLQMSKALLLKSYLYLFSLHIIDFLTQFNLSKNICLKSAD